MIRRIVALVVLPLVVVAGQTVTVLALVSRLPDPVAIHWGVDGRPDGYASPIGFAVMSIVVAGSVWILTAAVAGFFGRRPLYGARILGGLPLATVSIAVVFTVGPALVQLRQADPSLPWWIPVVGLAAAGVGWTIGGLVYGAPSPPAAVGGPVAADLPRVPLHAGVTAVWQGTTPHSRVLDAVAATGLLMAVAAGWLMPPAVGVTVVAVGLLVAVVVYAASSFTVTIGPAEVVVAGRWFGRPRIRVPLSTIRDVEVGTVSAWSFGGLGIRIGTGGQTAVITRSGPALVLTRTDGARLLVSLDRPDEAAAVLVSLLDRRPA